MRQTGNHLVVLATACLAMLVAGRGSVAADQAAERHVDVASAVHLDKLPRNQWVAVHDSSPGIIGVHARFLWLADRNEGFLWPCHDYRIRAFNFEQHAVVHFFSPPTGRWHGLPSTFPEGLSVRPDIVANSYVHLPGMRRILLLAPGGDRKGKMTVRSWLLDPKTRAWEALPDQPRMCDSSAEFNPSAGADGSPVPLWGVLVYDPLNKEAVSIGGGGTWGRVGQKPEKVQVGDWLYDESADPKRIRRVTRAEKGKAVEGRRWFPANCGTWVFPEGEKKWRPIEQALGEQPPGRILPGAAYDAGEQKIVLFGGDDFQKCLADTWLYDCKTRTWKQAKPETAPPPRAAHAMVYVPEAKVVLLAGGYGPGWVRLNDTWIYDTAKNTWTRLGLDLPVATQYCSADVEPQTRAVLLSVSNSSWGRNKKALLYGLRLDLATAPKAEPPPPGEANLDYHCKGKVWPAPLPEEWNGPENRPGDAEAGRKELADLPANTWVHRRPPMKPRARVWGKYIYDIRTHKGYAWGGGHGGYIGAEVSEYDLLTNRWRNMDDPVNYKLLWRHPSAGGSPGVSFQGWRLMGAHARKSYGVDPLSDSVITLHGDVFSITENRFVTNIGRAPGGRGLSGQEAYGTAPHGLYSYNFARQGRIGLLYRANVAAGKWDLVAKGGPANHREYDTFCHDAKRDRLVYVKSRGAAIWMFDFKTHKWSEEKPAGKSPPRVAGDTTYVHDMDAVMMVFAVEPKGEPRLHFYKLDEKKWYAAPYVGPKVGRFSQLNNSPHYDPRLKLLVRLSHYTREQFVEVAVMRLEPTTLKLAPIE